MNKMNLFFDIPVVEKGISIGVINAYTIKNFFNFHATDFLQMLSWYKKPGDTLYYITGQNESFALDNIWNTWKVNNYEVISLNDLMYNRPDITPKEFMDEVYELIKGKIDLLLTFHSRLWTTDGRRDIDYVYKCLDENKFDSIDMITRICKYELVKLVISTRIAKKSLHIMVDPLEYRYMSDERGLFNIQDIFYYEYENVKTFPFYGRVYKEIDVDKDNDFIFSCFLFTKARSKKVRPSLEKIVDVITSSDIRKKIYFLDYGKSKDYTVSAIPFMEYNNWVRRSRYTLVMPSGDPTHYTWWLRTYQAMINKCVPLVHRTCNFERMNQPCHKDVYDFVKDNDLFVDENDIVKKIKSLDYKKLAEEENKICQKKFDEDVFKQFYGNLNQFI